ncbi:hypothetical protein GJAV_G00078690 [Gymnothorax javanicus]|nr:hypothetical protein GJAV_G00078690 [Gymnothorax javanicus]
MWQCYRTHTSSLTSDRTDAMTGNVNLMKLVPLFGRSSDYGTHDTHMFRGVERVSPVATCRNLRLAVGELSAAPPHKQNFAKRRGNLNQGALCLQHRSKVIKGLDGSTVDGSTFSSLTSRGYDLKTERFDIEDNVPYVSGWNFQRDVKWTAHKTDSKYDFRERFPKQNSLIPPLPRDYQVQRSNQINRFLLRKEFSHSPPNPFSIRSSGNAQTSGLFRTGANKKSYTYVDPVCGASASFVARLSEMSSLEGETMRQENHKKLKKNKRLES